MSIVPEISEAIRRAVRDAGESEVLANHVIAWFDAIARGNTSFEDKEEVLRRMGDLYNSINLEEEE